VVRAWLPNGVVVFGGQGRGATSAEVVYKIASA
jgi:hypothetical protein